MSDLTPEPLGAGRVENRANVVHPRLDLPELAWAIREAGSTLVEHDQSRKRGKTPVHLPPVRIGPRKHEIAERRHEYEIVRSVPERLVRDRDIAAARVLDLGYVHAESVPLGGSPGQFARQDAERLHYFVSSAKR